MVKRRIGIGSMFDFRYHDLAPKRVEKRHLHWRLLVAISIRGISKKHWCLCALRPAIGLDFSIPQHVFCCGCKESCDYCYCHVEFRVHVVPIIAMFVSVGFLHESLCWRILEARPLLHNLWHLTCTWRVRLGFAHVKRLVTITYLYIHWVKHHFRHDKFGAPKTICSEGDRRWCQSLRCFFSKVCGSKLRAPTNEQHVLYMFVVDTHPLSLGLGSMILSHAQTYPYA